MTLFRRNRISLEEAERPLEHVSQEAAGLRQMLDGLRSREELARAFEPHVADAAVLLGQLRDRLGDVEGKDRGETKRQIVELLATRITVRTQGQGHRKQATISAEYAFRQPSKGSVDSRTAGLRGRRDRIGRPGPRSRVGS